MTPVRRFWPVGMVFLLVMSAGPLCGETPEPIPEEILLKKAGVGTDDAALLDLFRQRTLSDDELDELAEKVQRLGDPAFAVRQKATRELLAAGRSALVFLKAAQNDRDLERRRRADQCLQTIEATTEAGPIISAARLLAVRKPAGAAAVVLAYLPLVDDDELEEEFLITLRAVGTSAGKADDSLVAALKDRFPARRAAAAYVLGRLAAAARPRVEVLLQDSDARVRYRAALGLMAGQKKEAVPTLVALLEDGSEALAYQAEDKLRRIAGDRAPELALGNDERTRCRAAWDNWWKANSADLDAAALDVEQRMLGRTLICCCDGYNQGKGKVWEVDSKHKTCWEINTVNYPVDAALVSANRVLIAEQSGMRVTERDLKGNVLWEQPVRENLVSCQRLPNGNTFIATYSQVFEVTRDNKELYSYPTKHGTIYSAAKLRNGHIAYLGANDVLAVLDDKGQEIKALKVDASGAGLYKFDPQLNGRFLLGQNYEHKVIEFDGAGKKVGWCELSNVNSVERLPNGNLLACSWSEKRVVEVNRSGKLQWELKLEGGPLRVQRR